jgi:hypothetical protein
LNQSKDLLTQKPSFLKHGLGFPTYHGSAI